MSWLRIDDGFTKHPKFEGWTLAQKWAWLEVMEYCARYETRGRIPTDLSLMPRTTTPQLLALAEAAGWCDRVDEGGSPGSQTALWVHNWDEFNPPRLDEGELDQRVADAIAQHPDASANDIVRIVGGKRKPTLEAIRRFRTGANRGSPGTSDVVPDGGSRNHEGTGSRAGERARPRPVPTTKLQRSSGDKPFSSSPPPDSAAAPPAANGHLPADQPRHYTPEQGDALVRNALWDDPHLADSLREHFHDIPQTEIDRLAVIAVDVASTTKETP